MFVCNYKCIKEREPGTTTTKLWSDKLCFKQELAGKRQRDGGTLSEDIILPGFISQTLFYCCCRPTSFPSTL